VCVWVCVCGCVCVGLIQFNEDLSFFMLLVILSARVKK